MSEIDLQALAAEFPREQVSWRAQSVSKNGDKALALAFIDARDVMERLDAVCGPDRWSDSYEVHQNVTICTIAILLPSGWVSKADGAGDTDVEAEKGRISDAFKRAAVKWSVGRYLYALSSPWVPCESYDTGKKDNFGNVKWGWRKWTDDPWNHVRLPRSPSSGGMVVGRDSPPSAGVAPTGAKATAQRGLYDRLSKANRELKTIAEFNDFWDHKATQAAYWGFPDDWKSSLDAEKRDKEAKLSERAAKAVVPPDFSGIEQGKDGYEK